MADAEAHKGSFPILAKWHGEGRWTVDGDALFESFRACCAELDVPCHRRIPPAETHVDTTEAEGVVVTDPASQGKSTETGSTV